MRDALSSGDLRRIAFRTSLFARRGLGADAAAELAFGLAARDSDRDTRRCCIECSNYQTPQRGMTAGCFALQKVRRAEQDAAALGEKPRPRHALSPIEPMPTTLQRCAGFAFETP